MTEPQDVAPVEVAPPTARVGSWEVTATFPQGYMVTLHLADPQSHLRSFVVARVRSYFYLRALADGAASADLLSAAVMCHELVTA